MSVNYVIATWSGYTGRRVNKAPLMKDTLRDHLMQLVILSHQITQITIMEPINDGEIVEGYYDIDDIIIMLREKGIIIEQIKCLNRGYSNGQWITACEKYGKKFDYYLLVEDDYCPFRDHFDELHILKYKLLFPNKVGKMSGKFLGQGTTSGISENCPIHFECQCFFSSETFQIIQDTYPRIIDSLEELGNQFGEIIGYNGGHLQIAFTQLFVKAKIELQDFNFGRVVYWYDTPGVNVYLDKGESRPKVELNDRTDWIIGPVQLIDKNRHIHMGVKQTCILVLSNHRSGSSMVTSLLEDSGCFLGHSKSNHIDTHNSKGYFENMKILSFNERVLASLGSSWKTPTIPPINPDTSTVDELMFIINTDYNSEQLIAIKDPRIIYLYPIYIQALNKLNIRVKIIYINREHDNVCNSLSRVQKIPYELCSKLYYTYKNRGNNICEELDSLKINLQAVLNKQELDKISAFINHPSFRPTGNELIDNKLINFTSHAYRPSSYQSSTVFSLVFELIAKARPVNKFVEIGILDGYSLSEFLRFIPPSAPVIACDIFEQFNGNHSNYDKMIQKFAAYENVTILRMDFNDAHTMFNDIDIMHIDIANTGNTYKFAVENYLPKITPGGFMILEGGSNERDNVDWMIKYNKPPIKPYVDSLKRSNFEVHSIDIFPSITILRKI